MAEFDAVILSAGYSSRMQGFKPLYRLGAKTALCRVIRTFQEAGARNVLVVSGHNGPEVEAEAARHGAIPVSNPRFAEGMFSSVLAGCAALPPGADGFFILPVDIPLVRPATVRGLVAAFADHPASVTLPCFLGERGHPPLAKFSLKERILTWDGSGGLRGFFNRLEAESPGEIREVETPDRGTLLDMDTEADYARLRARRPDLPDPGECAAALSIIGTPERTILHGQSVAAVAVALGRAVNERLDPAGSPLDLELIEAAALVHDIAKGCKHHETRGAEILKEMGFSAIAPLVASHRDIAREPVPPLDESAMVFMADKLVAGCELVPVADRYGRVLERHGHDPEARAAIENRRANALDMEKRLEAATGGPLRPLARAALDSEDE